MFRRLVALVLIITLIPIFLIIGFVIYIDDGFPILFKQKRMGKKDNLFFIYKFRTMKKGTPDIPTHLIQTKQSLYIKSGIFLRELSLDELPQLFNIFRGELAFIGPRPALYNQHDLIAIRKKRGINRLMPGITGWAQVNGRDELDLNEKVQLDYYYLINNFFLLNIKILCLTIIKVVKKDGVSV